MPHLVDHLPSSISRTSTTGCQCTFHRETEPQQQQETQPPSPESTPCPIRCTPATTVLSWEAVTPLAELVVEGELEQVAVVMAVTHLTQ